MTPGVREGQSLDPPAYVALTLTHLTSALSLANIP